MQTEFVKRVCDQCGEKFEVEKGRPLSQGEADEWKHWITLVWEMPLPNGQGLKPVVKNCCRTLCATNFLHVFDPEAEIRAEFEKLNPPTDKPVLVGQA
jgi:hypothetical protein